MESANNGYIRGYQQLALNQKKHLNGQQKTQHILTIQEIGGYIKGDMGQDNFMNAETNPTKELFTR